jgi:hypothetical protein
MSTGRVAPDWKPLVGDGRYLRMPSSVIRSFSYDEAAHRLCVRFVSGRRYCYHDVPPEVAEALRTASSKGSVFNEMVRDRYAFDRMR